MIVIRDVRAQRAQLLFRYWFLAALFAIRDEFHQAFVPGRCGNVKGFLFDFMGIAMMSVWLGIRTPGKTWGSHLKS
jgi:VanZ family protein